MNNKLDNLIEKILLTFPLFPLIASTRIAGFVSLDGKLFIYKIIANIFELINKFNIYIYFLFIILFIYYIFKNSSNKIKLITILTIFTTLFSYTNSMLFKNYVVVVKYEIYNIILLHSFILFLLFLFTSYKNVGIKGLKDKLFKLIKIINIYIGVIYFISLISGMGIHSYDVYPYGNSAWFIGTNAIGHLLVMTLPFLLYLFYKEKNWFNLLIILINIIISLLIGTKAAYFGAFTSLIVFTLIYIYSIFRGLIFNRYKGFSILIILLIMFLFKNSFYAVNFVNNMPLLEINNTDNKAFNLFLYLIKSRDVYVFRMAEAFFNSDIFIKLFGLGMYFPRYNLVQVEMDWFDILFKYGFVALVMFLTIFIKKSIYIIKSIFTNRNYDYIFVIMISLSFLLGTAASFIAGHVLIAPTAAAIYSSSLVLLYLYFKNINNDINKDIKLNKKIFVYISFILTMFLLIITVFRQNNFYKIEKKMNLYVEMTSTLVDSTKEYIDNNEIIMPTNNEVLLVPLKNIYEKLYSPFDDEIDLNNSYILVMKNTVDYYYIPQIITTLKNKYSILLSLPYESLIPRESVLIVYSLEKNKIPKKEFDYVFVHDVYYYYSNTDEHNNVYCKIKEE